MGGVGLGFCEICCSTVGCAAQAGAWIFLRCFQQTNLRQQKLVLVLECVLALAGGVSDDRMRHVTKYICTGLVRPACFKDGPPEASLTTNTYIVLICTKHRGLI